jgi:23S rRNA (uridine2552-2'-O)-methyltransferase
VKKIKDHYFHKAKKDGYAARSVYKIEEIDKKYRIIRTGNKVLDLGCSPGSWLQYASIKVGNSGHVLGVDLQPVKISLPSHVKVIQADIFEVTDEDLKIKGGKADVILSDMAPKTSGIRTTDAHRSFELNKKVLYLANDILCPEGSLLVKAFQGKLFDELCYEFKKMFTDVKLCKPKSSRSESVEIFILGRGKKRII